MAPNRVKIFALSTCIHCRKAKEFLEGKEIQFECIYVDKLDGDEKKATVEEVKTHNPKLSFPTILVDEEVIVGFNKDKLEKSFA